MAEKPAPLPLNIITQVKRDEQQDDEDYSGGISARPSRNGEDADALPLHKPSLFRRVFCCFASEAEAASRNRARTAIGEGEYLLPRQPPELSGRVCCVLDLDETLVHSSFKPIPNADYIIPVEIEDQVHQVYVVKRPHVDEFMKHCGELFEVVVFTASLSKYADPVLDLLDKYKVVKWRLFREACSNHKGNYVKDMSRLGRSLKRALIIDNSPASYMFHPENALPCDSWFDDESDTELLELIDFLTEISKAEDVRIPLRAYAQKYAARG